VPVPVVTVTRREGGAVAMRAGTVLQICPEAPNHAFFLATGARPAIQLDMEGDDEFEVVLRGAQNAQLDRARSRATVRIVSAAEMAALEQQAEAMGAAAAVDKEEAEALAAEVAASKERAEAEEAKRRWLAEEAESKEAEAALEAAYVAQHAAEKLVADKEAEASAAERQIDAWRARAAQAGARRKELFPGFAPLEHDAQRLHKVPCRGRPRLVRARSRCAPGGTGHLRLIHGSQVRKKNSEEYEAALAKLQEQPPRAPPSSPPASLLRPVLGAALSLASWARDVIFGRQALKDEYEALGAEICSADAQAAPAPRAEAGKCTFLSLAGACGGCGA